MRVFMCEFVTGGGLRGGPLPPSLAHEGAMMRDALARDLGDLAGVDVSTSHDDRLAAPACPSVAVGPGDDAWRLWARLAGEADAAWIVAPETGGVLERLAALCRSAGAAVIGPDLDTIRIASSKTATAARLRAAGVPTPPVWALGAVPPEQNGPFVTKPDDGAGCEATRLWTALPTSAALPADSVVQSFVDGEAASLTVLRQNGETRLLAANRQLVAVADGSFRFDGVVVSALRDFDGRLERLAQAVGDALPGLAGIFGIDVVIGPDGPVVIEVNPRLTTAYAGLREAIGVNPAALIDLFATPGAPPPAVAGNAVEVRP